jgi:hypothetical protein
MGSELVIPSAAGAPAARGGPLLPAIIADAGERAAKRFLEFFTATIRNPHTRKAYARATGDFFAWCHGIAPPGWQSLCLAEQIAQMSCRTDVD